MHSCTFAYNKKIRIVENKSPFKLKFSIFINNIFKNMNKKCLSIKLETFKSNCIRK